jgi:hypothetical protein
MELIYIYKTLGHLFSNRVIRFSSVSIILPMAHTQLPINASLFSKISGNSLEIFKNVML